MSEPDNIPFFVPHKYNPHFVGRSDDLKTLHAALQGQTANDGGITIVTGDGAGNVYCLHYVEPGEP